MKENVCCPLSRWPASEVWYKKNHQQCNVYILVIKYFLKNVKHPQTHFYVAITENILNGIYGNWGRELG